METTWLRKERGGTQIGPYSWPEDGSVTEVDEETARGLLAIPDSGFSVAEPSETPEAGSGEASTPEDIGGPAAAPARTRRSSKSQPTA